MIGVYDDLPAENFGNLPPLPEGYAVVWTESDEMFCWTIRGTDIESASTWNRYWARKGAIAHAARSDKRTEQEPR